MYICIYVIVYVYVYMYVYIKNIYWHFAPHPSLSRIDCIRKPRFITWVQTTQRSWSWTNVPTMHAPPEYQRRLRPSHDGSFNWLLDLGQIFADSAEDEAFEDEPLLYVQTWFMHHERHWSCRAPRPLRFERQPVPWIDDFRHLWRDLLDRRHQFSLHVVRPKPPQPGFSNFACHVLVEQIPCEACSAVILTALIEVIVVTGSFWTRSHHSHGSGTKSSCPCDQGTYPQGVAPASVSNLQSRGPVWSSG